MGSVRRFILTALGLIFGVMVLLDLPRFIFPGLFVYSAGKDSMTVVNLSLPGGIPSKYITQGYGATAFAYSAWDYTKPWHNGVDIAAAEGAPILSEQDGVVVFAGNQDNYCPGRGFGKFVVVKNNGDGFFLLYAHLSEIDVASGDKAPKGDIIGRVGMTGFATAPHLHFSVFKPSGFSIADRNGCGPDAVGQDIDPLSYLK